LWNITLVSWRWWKRMINSVFPEHSFIQTCICTYRIRCIVHRTEVMMIRNDRMDDHHVRLHERAENKTICTNRTSSGLWISTLVPWRWRMNSTFVNSFYILTCICIYEFVFLQCTPKRCEIGRNDQWRIVMSACMREKWMRGYRWLLSRYSYTNVYVGEYQQKRDRHIERRKQLKRVLHQQLLKFPTACIVAERNRFLQEQTFLNGMSCCKT